MKITRTATLATVSVAALLALAACGNNEAKVEKAPTDATPAESAAMAPVTTEPMVGGVAMNPADNIVANASKAPNLTTLVAAVQAAGLATTLQGAGPFTVFAPDNAAFEKIPAATREGWMQPAQKAALTKVLTYHVVPGRLTAADIAAEAQKGGGTATLTTREADDQGRRRRQVDHHRRQGRNLDHHPGRRRSVERRGPRHRHGADAEIIRQAQAENERRAAANAGNGPSEFGRLESRPIRRRGSVRERSRPVRPSWSEARPRTPSGPKP